FRLRQRERLWLRRDHPGLDQPDVSRDITRDPERPRSVPAGDAVGITLGSGPRRAHGSSQLRPRVARAIDDYLVPTSRASEEAMYVYDTTLQRVQELFLRRASDQSLSYGLR